MSRESRRSFLKMSGFGFLAACTRGVETKAIPLLLPVEERVPGVSAWYASLCAGCPAGCGALVRSRDGSPVKLEGNPRHPVSRGGLCAVGQASVLGVYDSQRLSRPLAMGTATGWREIDEAVRGRVARGGAVRFLTGTVNSPTVAAAIRRFGARFDDFRHVQYDVLSCSAMLDVHGEMFGRRALPRPRFDRALVIAGIDADFLGTWISPVEFARDYRAGRDVDGDDHSYHVHFEGRMSLTGSNADRRHARADLAQVAAELATAVCERLGEPLPFAAKPSPETSDAADRLVNAPHGRSLVVCGVDDVDVQRLVAHVNFLLGAYGGTLATDRLSRQRQGSAAGLAALRREVESGAVDLLLVAGCNPAYDLPGGLDTSRVGAVVSFAEREDETAAQAHFVCPDHHALESWGDAEAVDGVVTVCQPTLRPLGDTRALVESLARWTGDGRSAYEIMRATWRGSVHPRSGNEGSFDAFWNRAVHDGVAELPASPAPPREPGSLRAPARPTREEGQFVLVLYPKVGMLDGRHAHNPWLHELPDPVTKVVWDNYACLSADAAARLGVERGDLVDVGGVELPALIQPGQHDDVVAVAIGYGRKGTDRFAHVGPDWLEGDPTVAPGELVGRNTAPLAGTAFAAVRPAGGRRTLAATQTWDSMIVPEHLGGTKRAPARETTLAEHRRGDAEESGHASADLWPDDHAFAGHHWGMAVDLSACTGCSACVVGCQAENNVPVVGKDEVSRSREMAWMRIDRYYGGADGDVTTAHQPMMCQHCDNAPCESVCPVLATVQSSEGLNQQVYNRCVGTRYCANNCPYKVRRFNWFDYPRDDTLANNALNPDVVVRMRGVMEKCSFCIQRIYEAKAAARREGRAVRDGEIQPACVQSCPTNALLFGDLNDDKSRVRGAWRDRRRYRVLEDLNTKPGVAYLSLVRNRDA